MECLPWSKFHLCHVSARYSFHPPKGTAIYDAFCNQNPNDLQVSIWHRRSETAATVVPLGMSPNNVELLYRRSVVIHMHDCAQMRKRILGGSNQWQKSSGLHSKTPFDGLRPIRSESEQGNLHIEIICALSIAQHQQWQQQKEESDFKMNNKDCC